MTVLKVLGLRAGCELLRFCDRFHIPLAHLYGGPIGRIWLQQQLRYGRKLPSQTSKLQDGTGLAEWEHGLVALETHVEPEVESDAALIELFQKGDRDAFRRLYEAHKNRVYSIAIYFFRGDTASAEDVTQDVFVRLYSALHGFKSRADFKTWLYRMVSNACIDELRARKRLVRLETVDVANASDDTFDRLDLSRDIQDALNSLSEEARVTVLLKYFEELSYQEMAAALKCRQGTVASRLNRALKALAVKLELPGHGKTLRDPMDSN